MPAPLMAMHGSVAVVSLIVIVSMVGFRLMLQYGYCFGNTPLVVESLNNISRSFVGSQGTNYKQETHGSALMRHETIGWRNLQCHGALERRRRRRSSSDETRQARLTLARRLLLPPAKLGTSRPIPHCLSNFRKVSYLLYHTAIGKKGKHTS